MTIFIHKITVSQFDCSYNIKQARPVSETAHLIASDACHFTSDWPTQHVNTNQYELLNWQLAMAHYLLLYFLIEGVCGFSIRQ